MFKYCAGWCRYSTPVKMGAHDLWASAESVIAKHHRAGLGMQNENQVVLDISQIDSSV